MKANLEGDVFVRRASVEPQDGEAGVIRLLEVVLGGLLTVDQVRVEHVELVALGVGKKNKTKNRNIGRKTGSRSMQGTCSPFSVTIRENCIPGIWQS